MVYGIDNSNTGETNGTVTTHPTQFCPKWF